MKRVFVGDVERSSSMGAVSTMVVLSDATNNTEWQGLKRRGRYQEHSHGVLKREGCALTNGRGGLKTKQVQEMGSWRKGAQNLKEI